ncbi:MAG: 23S rRNA (pseudouridine(1915)-N(3))-methyltransferase RlmH [Pseudomonadota bacterium]
MKLRMLAVGAKSPDWVTAGFNDYARRLPRDCPLTLEEIAPANRKGWPPARVLATEADALLARLKPAEHVVALDVGGKTCSTERLAQMLDDWRMQGKDVSFLIGGADGLGQAVLDRSDQALSLSAMTFPHQLVRVLLAEQLYRAWTVLAGHPYHRA